MQQAQASLIKKHNAVWTRLPQTADEILVEKGTGCIFQDSAGTPFVRKANLPLSDYDPIDLTKARQTMIASEGRIPWLYRDSKNIMTVGVGHRVRGLSEAQMLNFVFPGTGQRATTQQIAKEYNQISPSPTPDKHGAGYYRSMTTIRLHPAEIDQLLDQDIQDKVKLLGAPKYFPDFDSYPKPAKDALVDMAFNMGVFRIVSVFQNFTAAVRSRDWSAAAVESRRKDVSNKRNRDTENLILLAARIEPFVYDRRCSPIVVNYKFQP